MQQAVSYDLGLDIGIASVGWCVLGERHIIDLGVRAFDKAETPDGESLNTARRTARLLRRRLRRRAWRLLKLSRLLKREGLITDSRLFLQQTPITQSLWKLRAEALDRQLNTEEWARVIYHICKHRGFWFASKADAEGSEGGKVKQGLERTRNLMREHGYRSAAEMMLAQFPNNQRNKRGDYGQSLSRELLADELHSLFEKQREFGNPHTNDDFKDAILNTKTGLLWQQKPALSGKEMLERIGFCTFERKKSGKNKDEYRAAKHTWSAERFVWLTRLNNLRININGESRPLSEVERKAVIDLPYEKAKLTHKQLKAHLIKLGPWPEAVRFTGLNYRDNSKDPEESKLIELTGWHTLRTTLEKAGLKTEWQGIATQPLLINAITSILSIYKTDEEIQRELTACNLTPAVINSLLAISFSDFIRLSLKALDGILPGMERGQRYDEACLAAGYHHSVLVENSASRFLPAFDEDAPNNPVVKRALNQTRKVVNAIIRQYGAPQRVHIEMARDLSRPLDERYKIEKAQSEFAERNEKDRERFSEAFGRRPTGREFEKWQLYQEQDGKCAYSLSPLDLNRLIDDANYAEVDHALPYSRSFDDSKNNKVLALTRENRDKANRTPFEYLDGASDSERWQRYAAAVNSNKKYRQAKRDRLLRQQFGKDEASGFIERNLNDTRYICKYFKNFVEQHLKLASDAKRCIVVSGQLTSFLRARWGLAKLREGSDRHHAVDAAVVAACSAGMVKRLSDYARRKETLNAKDGLIDLETGEVANLAMWRQLEQHFPRPWEHFEMELSLRAGLDRSTGKVNNTLSLELTREALAALGYDETMLSSIRPLFVSRAPQRRNSGAAHKDTIYAQRPMPAQPNRVTQKIALSALKLSDLDLDPERCGLIEPHRNVALYTALRERLEAFGGKADKAFATPFYKPTRDGSQGPIVRTVTKVIDNLSGIALRGGIAKNDSMLRVDVFTKAGKFHLVPIYVQHRIIKNVKDLPNRAIVAAKEESDWTQIDDTFSFCFSLHPNDLVRIQLKGKPAIEGYYSGCDRATGGVNLWVHDRNQAIGKDGLIRGVGVKVALSVDKFNVNVLGQVYLNQAGSRRGLA
ncbi:type II CRISPR RNA-guided endonuclease Cas9 [Deefgea piscis]|uniref:CRISPR-associated endonuclease Cas9 n=1 Tax=Deefgea piscis TaxID=2739061 RepID=A0A6M8STC3_9NEIS|nr:type II CRISPR RNA-guided endonuclease Cas9 [Deefgea piscis]QKJ67318.1 type II CRISPR RNA-guided endonuclease Cas9 [Deefgea piscis]